MLKVLIATVTAGAGHVQAAAALEEAWKRLRPRDRVERWDVLDFFPRLYRKPYADGYLKLVEKAPELYAYAFKKTDDPALVRKLAKFRRLASGLTAAGFAKKTAQFAPDVVVCTHFLPPEVLGREKPCPIVTVVTDFEAHALWQEDSVDLYCVAAPETRARLVARGARRVEVTGIPVAGKFAAAPSKAAARKALGLDARLRTLLVLGGGFGVGPVGDILSQLDVAGPHQALVVCGRNEDLRKKLAAQKRRHPTRVLGFSTNMHELMAASDLILTKPGGLTVSEALAVGRPLLVINPIPGQEAANSDFLLERGAAAKANRLEDIPYRLETLPLKKLAAGAAKLGWPDAAGSVVKLAAKLAGR